LLHEIESNKHGKLQVGFVPITPRIVNAFNKVIIDFSAPVFMLPYANLSPKTIVITSQIHTFTKKKPKKTIKVNVIRKF
jgi:hypothetical protein